MKNIIEQAREIQKETTQQVRGLVFDGVRPLIVEMLEQQQPEGESDLLPSDDAGQIDNITNPPPNNQVPPNAAGAAPQDPAAPAEPSPLDSLPSPDTMPPAMPVPQAPVPQPEGAAMPIQASPVSGMPMPGPDGKITVNFQDLWSTSAVVPPAPAPTTDQSVSSLGQNPTATNTDPLASLDNVPGMDGSPPSPELSQTQGTNTQPSVAEDETMPPELQLEEKIHSLGEALFELRKTNKTNNLTTEQKKFFELVLLEMLENLDGLRLSSTTGKIKKLQLETKLNYIYNSVLTESTKNDNTYHQSRGSERMNKATLREFKAKLAIKEETAAPYLNVGEKNMGDALGKDLKQNQEAASQDSKAQKASDTRPIKDPGKAPLPAESKHDKEQPWEKGTAKGKGAADPAKETSISENALELLEAELMEMLGVEGEDEKPEVVEEETSLEECAGEPATVNVTISAGPGVNLGMDGDSDVSGLSLGDEDDDDEIQILADDDEEVADSAMPKSFEPEDDEVVDDEEDEVDDEEEDVASKPPMVSELKRQLAEVRNELNETQVLTACSLYTNKLFANNHNLSERQKRKIVEYFDGVGTIAEAKAVYTRIKKVIAESAVKNSLNESVSRPVKPASKREVINESKNDTPFGRMSFNLDRWQVLAGIGKK